jgi:hypothetical protein
MVLPLRRTATVLAVVACWQLTDPPIYENLPVGHAMSSPVFLYSLVLHNGLEIFEANRRKISSERRPVRAERKHFVEDQIVGQHRVILGSPVFIFGRFDFPSRSSVPSQPELRDFVIGKSEVNGLHQRDERLGIGGPAERFVCWLI